jgi:hypothetical protein
MNEDYLWDKSGDPDPEIEQLENVMGRLRFKSPVEPLPLPVMVTPRRLFQLRFSPTLAAAAALLILLLAGGVWLGLRRSSSTQVTAPLATGTAPAEEKRVETGVSGPRPPIGPENPGAHKVVVSSTTPDAVKPPVVAPRNKLSRRFSAPHQEMARSRERKATPHREQLAREGEAAKAQLILALHIASDKLNSVQKKIQGNPGT